MNVVESVRETALLYHSLFLLFNVFLLNLSILFNITDANVIIITTIVIAIVISVIIVKAIIGCFFFLFLGF